MVNEATTRANEATPPIAAKGLGAHQPLLEGYGQRFAGSARCGSLQHFFINAYATHRRRRTLRVWRSTTWTLATGSSAASTTSTPLSNPPALASPKPARSAPSSCRWHSLAVHDSVVHHSPSLPTLNLSSGPGGTPSGGGPVRIRKMALSRSGCCSSSIAAAIAIAICPCVPVCVPACAACRRHVLWACVRVSGPLGEGCTVLESSERLDIGSRAQCPVSVILCLPFCISAFAIVCACLCAYAVVLCRSQSRTISPKTCSGGVFDLLGR